MINLIKINGDGHKVARPVKNRKEYLALRNAARNVNNFRRARDGDKKAKACLLQFNYNALLPDGVLKNCRHVASTFALDIDCGKEAVCRETAQRILAQKDAVGLLELSVSSGWGLHGVFRREQGKTILENQVRVATAIQTEMDTNAHDLPRVMYTGPADEDTLLYLDDAIFEEAMTMEEAAAEYERLTDREKCGLEEVPAEAKKSKKHYRPWDTQGTGTTVPCKQSTDGSQAPCVTEAPAFKGRPYAEIIAEWWNRNGGEPQEGERNVKLYQLAVNLRAICDNNKELLLKVMPRLGLDEQELRSIVESACKETPKGISKVMLEIISQGDKKSGRQGVQDDTINSQLD